MMISALCRFSQAHAFEKPNDERALRLMNASAKALMEDQPDCIFAYGVSDEYRWDCTYFWHSCDGEENLLKNL